MVLRLIQIERLKEIIGPILSVISIVTPSILRLCCLMRLFSALSAGFLPSSGPKRENEMLLFVLEKKERRRETLSHKSQGPAAQTKRALACVASRKRHPQPIKTSLRFNLAGQDSKYTRLFGGFSTRLSFVSGRIRYFHADVPLFAIHGLCV